MMNFNCELFWCQKGVSWQAYNQALWIGKSKNWEEEI